MSEDCLNFVQCATVRDIGNAQSHITPETDTTPRTLSAQTSLKALSDAVLARTLPRTLPAQKDESGRTLPAHNERAAHTAKQDELAELVGNCGECYGFTKAELLEAHEAASHDPVNALICFRSVASGLRGDL
jgi:hypothetical protein